MLAPNVRNLARTPGAVHISSFEQDFDDSRGAGVAPDERGVSAVHLLEVRRRVGIEHPEPRGPPNPPEVNPEPATAFLGVAYPLGTGTIFDDHDDPATVIEVADRDTAPLS